MTRATELRSRRAVLICYVRSGSAAVLVPALIGLAVLRLRIGRWGWADVGVVAVLGVLTGFVEWVAHRYLLHAPPDAWSRRRLGIGVAHRRHHDEPADLRWVLLTPLDAALFLVVLSAFSAAWIALPVVAFGEVVVAPVTTGVLATALALVHYELVHLLAHARVRPRSRFYARLARNHLRHHGDERRWLGVTSNLGDRVLGTMRSAPSAN